MDNEAKGKEFRTMGYFGGARGMGAGAPGGNWRWRQKLWFLKDYAPLFQGKGDAE